MGKLTITVETGSDAFHSCFEDMDAYNTRNEIERVLERASRKLNMIEGAEMVSVLLHDTNGNACGKMVWEETP